MFHLGGFPELDTPVCRIMNAGKSIFLTKSSNNTVARCIVNSVPFFRNPGKYYDKSLITMLQTKSDLIAVFYAKGAQSLEITPNIA